LSRASTIVASRIRLASRRQFVVQASACPTRSGRWKAELLTTAAPAHARAGFTLIELLVVVAIIGILAGMLMPALATAKKQANRVKCISQQRQLHLAATMYADEHEDELPPKRHMAQSWLSELQPYYQSETLLRCPSDGYSVRWSYLINAFNDWFQANLSSTDFDSYLQWQWPHGMRMTAIPEPSETILFGEKRTDSFHVHMDFIQDNDLIDIEHARHIGSAQKTGGSCFGFVDGSARFLRYGTSINPLNLWAVTEKWRGTPMKPN
jgi:prepilin-type N-terminal cleavage/methylation domain-containing protein